MEGTLQKAVYDTLTNDSTLMSKISGVFDYVPTDQAYPYVTIGDITGTEEDTFTSNVGNLTILVHIWTQAPGSLGFADAQAIKADVNRLLHRKTLTGGISGWFETSQQITDPDGVTRHMPCRYRFYVEEAL